MSQKAISPARLKFQSAAVGTENFKKGNNLIEEDNQGNYYLNVSVISVNDSYRVVN
ncbi:hypothetical protein BJQ96_02278 [Flavobacterium sp. PL0002]|nr:hypothetical protein [Flavobacterium sp. PL002]